MIWRNWSFRFQRDSTVTGDIAAGGCFQVLLVHSLCRLTQIGSHCALHVTAYLVGAAYQGVPKNTY